MRSSLAAFALACLGLTACGDATKSGVAPAPSATACVRFGDRCELSPGKLGACVEKTGCTGPGCLVCQSQH